MTEAEYRAAPGVNKSTLWELRRSPAHYHWALEHPREDTAALRLGRAAHAAILQPRAFAVGYAVLPSGLDRRTKAGREEAERFEAENAGKEILRAEDAEAVRGMRRAVRESRAARDLLRGTRREVPLFWTDPGTGLPCKCRVDALKAGIVLDLKTTEDASTEAFIRDALRLGYDVQAAHYLNGVKARRKWPSVAWYFLAVEKHPPYGVNVLRAEEGFLDRGRWRLMEMLERLRACQEADDWPGYGENDLILPAWAAEWGD